MWRSHVRVLTFEGAAAEDDVPCPCLPQGDPFSPAALGLVLAPVLRKIAHEQGDAQKQLTYIDDRT
eukprot:9103351-Alexandrium_andersonii.AAC.1